MSKTEKNQNEIDNELDEEIVLEGEDVGPDTGDDEDKGEELDETVAADTLKTKSAMIGKMVQTAAGMSYQDLSDWFHKAIETSKKYADTVPTGAAAKNKASVQPKGSPIVKAVKEDVESLFESGTTIDENFREKAVVLFEAAVNARVAIEVQKIQEEIEQKQEQEIAEAIEDIKRQNDEYLNYAVGEWLEQNQVAIERSLRLEMVEDFMDALHQVFVEHYVEVPEDKIDVVEALSDRVAELEEKLNEEMEKNIDIKNEQLKLVALDTFKEVAEGLTETDVERFKTLSETVEFFGDVEDLKEKLSIIREANFKSTTTGNKSAAKVLTEGEGTIIVDGKEINENDEKRVVNVDPRMASYIAAVSRTLR